MLEKDISRVIAEGYHKKLSESIESDVLIAGAGPSGLASAYYLARNGLKVTLLEKRLAPGGGIWGGGMAMNEVVVQDDALSLLQEMAVSCRDAEAGLFTVNAIELAAGMCLSAIRAGVVLLNLMTVEDVCIHDGRVNGAVVNRTMISGVLPVDPLAFSAGAVIDATGHEAAVVETLRKRNLLPRSAEVHCPGEAPMDAEAGEKFVVDRPAEVYPGLWVTGMSVCATFGGPRMGPVFGGMILSGIRAAEKVIEALENANSEKGNG